MTTATTSPGTADRALLASRWHTAAFVGFFVLLTAGGALLQNGATAHPDKLREHPNVVGLYLALIGAEWGLVFWVTRGLRQSGTRLRDVVGGRWRGPADVARDLVLGAAVWALWTMVLILRDRWLGPGQAASIDALLPRRAVEAVLWVALSMSAGFCEEVAFRGYLQRQFRALGGSTTLAIVMQALLFGISHGYQGVRATVSIAAYAVLLGLIASWRNSLRPGIVAHAWSDIFAGLLAR